MQTNISQSDLDNIERTLELEAVRTSKVSDSKNIFKSEAKENAFRLRYGKNIKITISYELNGKKIKEMTLRFQSEQNKVYSLTEYFTEQETTDYVILACRRQSRNFEYKFDRYLDAEVSLADMLSEEVGA